MIMEQNSSASFLSNQLVWHPTVLARDGHDLGGSPEFIVSDSPEETTRTLSAFFNSIERQGADIHKTVYSELERLRFAASQLSDMLRASRSIPEATINGKRLKNVMSFLRILESHYLSDTRRDGTTGD